MYERILVPTDGSEATTKTLDHALGVAAPDATVHALYVVDRRLYLAAEKDEQDDVRDRLHQEGSDAVEAVAAYVGEDAEVVTAVEEGIPHKRIVEYAEEAGLDLVAIGTHGKTGRERMVGLGSVTEEVVERSGVPTLVVRIDDDQSADEEREG